MSFSAPAIMVDLWFEEDTGRPTRKKCATIVAHVLLRNTCRQFWTHQHIGLFFLYSGFFSSNGARFILGKPLPARKAGSHCFDDHARVPASPCWGSPTSIGLVSKPSSPCRLPNQLRYSWHTNSNHPSRVKKDSTAALPQSRCHPISMTGSNNQEVRPRMP